MQAGLKSDDVFRAELARTMASLNQWAKSHEECAATSIRSALGYWKMAVSPLTPGACPFELQLRSDQRYDLAIAGEFYEDRQIGNFGMFPALTAAIAAGHVSRILTTSALTGALQSLETSLTLADGAAWSASRSLAPEHQRCPLEFEVKEVRRFLPYRR